MGAKLSLPEFCQILRRTTFVNATEYISSSCDAPVLPGSGDVNSEAEDCVFRKTSEIIDQSMKVEEVAAYSLIIGTTTVLLLLLLLVAFIIVILRLKLKMKKIQR